MVICPYCGSDKGVVVILLTIFMIICFFFMIGSDDKYEKFYSTLSFISILVSIVILFMTI